MSLVIKIKPLVLVGCSGSGRNALMYHLIHNLPYKFQRLISYTTRRPRKAQVNNRDFYFVDQKFIKQNENKFVTLTYSVNNNYYALTGQQVARIMKNNKIPIFKMTLDAYCNNIQTNRKVSINITPIEKKDFDSAINQGVLDQLQKQSNLCLIRDKKIQCNALYITLPSLKQLQRRLKFSPFTQKERFQKIQNARLQHRKAEQFFQKQNIIGKYFDQVEDNIQEEEDFQDKIRRLQSRLFQIY